MSAKPLFYRTSDPGAHRGPGKAVSSRSMPEDSIDTRQGSKRSATMLKRLEAIEHDLSQHATYTGKSRWMIPYADMVTVLLGFFIVLYALQSPLNKPPVKSIVNGEVNSLESNTSNTTASKPPVTAKPRRLSLSLPSELNSLKTALQGSALSNQDIAFREEHRGLVITLKNQILFPSGSAILTPAAKETLNKLSDVLKQTHQPIRVEGHTDNTPIATTQYPSNFELSTARATEILRYLIEARHFSPAQLSASGYGEYKPLALNSSIQGKQKNRRVDIVILSTVASEAEPHEANPQMTDNGKVGKGPWRDQQSPKI
ncbi:MAG: flagellar motor protein MotB [Cyanobacteria bacterium]|nr:flagellar motor protein MotB [Cyanobacteriota bacterium]